MRLNEGMGWRTSPNGDLKREEPGVDMATGGLLERSEDSECGIERCEGCEELVPVRILVHHWWHCLVLVDFFHDCCKTKSRQAKATRGERD